MAGVAQANVIDVVGQDASGPYLEVMIEERQWGAEEDQASQLKAKINAYFVFITDGSLSRCYPETEGKPVDIQLNCREPPSGEFAALLEHASRQLQQFGIQFRVNITG